MGCVFLPYGYYSIASTSNNRKDPNYRKGAPNYRKGVTLVRSAVKTNEKTHLTHAAPN